MKKEEIIKALERLKKNSKKRNFKQKVDLVINLKNIDVKKDNVDNFIVLPFSSKINKVCGIVDEELLKEAKGSCDEVISKTEIAKYRDKKMVKKLAKNNDFFIAQASLMGETASVFGRVLGPLGKMPNPKYGGVVLPGGSVRQVVEKFKRLTRVRTNKEASVKVNVGDEEMKNEDIAANIASVYESVVNSLSNGESNIKKVMVKLTMSSPVAVGKDE